MNASDGDVETSILLRDQPGTPLHSLSPPPSVAQRKTSRARSLHRGFCSCMLTLREAKALIVFSCLRSIVFENFDCNFLCAFKQVLFLENFYND